jgi:N-acetylmuramic acid 6-phosphate etherase
VGPATTLLAALPAARGFPSFSELGSWVRGAGKKDMADLAKTVCACAESRDPVALACVEKEAAALAAQALAAFGRLALPKETPVFFSGGLIEGSPLFREAFQEALNRVRAGLVPAPIPISGHRAVLELSEVDRRAGVLSLWEVGVGHAPDLPVTEAFLGGRPIDQRTAPQIVRLMNHEDARLAGAVALEESAIAAAVEKVAGALSSGGRLIYAGAGTSGRLGVLDASECPPTFGVEPGRVVGLMAGGDRALRLSTEGVEDDRDRGAEDLATLQPLLTAKDVVVGITASGTTPYVRGALEEADRRGAGTILLCCNPALKDVAPLVIAVATGPEVLAGSTRLKAGTAIKMVLNMISTGAMALSGYIFEGRMVGIRPLNQKLRRRAVSIVMILAGVDEQRAVALLEEAKHRIPVAVVMGRKNLDAEDAAARLDRANGSLRAALGED